jgi:hypothetical protein
MPPVDASGQPDVGGEHVGDPPPAPCQGLLASGRMDHFVALLAQRLHHELANEGIVLDDEYSHRRLPNPEI